ncbi:hypothetical protein ACWF9G_27905 [Nocardia sp. NPDC055029]|uniref:hypothetical protein n=1 Tax=Nocardia sp. NPDC060259 TaxID=3347088 RepID=UPI0036587344
MGSTSTTKEAKYLPDASLITVTLDGSDGSARDQRTETSPIFGSLSFRHEVTVNLALRVNRIDCRLSLRDRYFGGATRAPLSCIAAAQSDNTVGL